VPERRKRFSCQRAPGRTLPVRLAVALWQRTLQSSPSDVPKRNRSSRFGCLSTGRHQKADQNETGLHLLTCAKTRNRPETERVCAWREKLRLPQNATQCQADTLSSETLSCSDSLTGPSSPSEPFCSEASCSGLSVNTSPSGVISKKLSVKARPDRFLSV
jgi:hypothetical protein